MSKPFRKSTAREYFESIVIAVILALFIRTFVVQAFKIPTGSMENNLLIGDHLLVNKFTFGPAASSLERALLPFRTIQRGDVIVFKYPEEPARDFIKRVIGLPGDTVELRDKKVSINGTPLDEPYVHFIEPPGATSEFREVTSFDVRERYGPVTVPANQYFVMGDNRDNSQDSRYWGFLPRDYVKGRALVIYWSYDAGPEVYDEGSAGDTLKGLGSVFVHFFHADPLGPHVPSNPLIKLLIKLAVVAIVANATWRIGSAYVAHYKFTDSVQQTTLFRGQRSDEQLRARVFEIASDFDIPVTEEDLSLKTEDHHTKVDGSYVREIEVFPGYKYRWPFEFHTDTLSGVL